MAARKKHVKKKPAVRKKAGKSLARKPKRKAAARKPTRKSPARKPKAAARRSSAGEAELVYTDLRKTAVGWQLSRLR
jgi:hypothetical protein